MVIDWTKEENLHGKWYQYHFPCDLCCPVTFVCVFLPVHARFQCPSPCTFLSNCFHCVLWCFYFKPSKCNIFDWSFVSIFDKVVIGYHLNSRTTTFLALDGPLGCGGLRKCHFSETQWMWPLVPRFLSKMGSNLYIPNQFKQANPSEWWRGIFRQMFNNQRLGLLENSIFF